MRIPFFASLVLCSLVPSLGVAELPPPATPEIPVTAPALTAAALDQSPVAADSNGSMAVVAWDDDRSGERLAYASRIGEGGEVLDPLGIRLGHGVPRLVLSTGGRFLVLLKTPVLHELIFIDSLGMIDERLQIEVEDPYVATLEGPEFDQLLFLAQAPHDSGASYLRGIMVALLPGGPSLRRIDLPLAPPGLVDTHWIGASDGTDLIVLRYQRRQSGAGADRIVADRIAGDGSIVSSSDTGLTGTLEALDVLAGRSDGYLLIRHIRPETSELRSFRLNQAGVYTGETGTLGSPAPGPFTEVRLVPDGTGYLFAWRSPMPSAGITRSYVTSVTPAGIFGSPNLVGDWRGSVAGLALASQGSHRLVFEGVRLQFSSSWFDVMATLLTDTLATAAQSLVTQSATLQSEVRVAGSEQGYIVGWGENGPDLSSRAFIRRFSQGGAPIDATPREIFAVQQETSIFRLPSVRVAATADHYVVTWLTADGLFARRIPAFGGDWLDSEPVRIAASASHYDVAANSSHALIVWTSACSQGQLCVMSRRLAMSGGADLRPEEVVSGRGFSYDVTVASNGNDFLVAWSEGRRDCVPTCSLDPSSLLGARVSAGGIPLDPVALPIEERRTFAEKPVIAWDGSNYVVLWASFATGGWSVRGVRVSPEGAIHEKQANGDGTVVEAGVFPRSTQPVLARFGDVIVLMTRRLDVLHQNTQVVWSEVTFASRTPLAEVRPLPRREVLRHESELFGTLHASSSPNGLLYLGYDRVAEGLAAGVPRAFVTRFGVADPSRRRAVRR